MGFFQCIWIYGILVTTSYAVEHEESTVSLTPKYAYQYIILVCNVKSPNVERYSVYLNCPFGVNQICYKNCNAACTEEGCIPMITKCSIISRNSRFIQIEWTIDTTMINKTGEWKCGHANIYSNAVTVAEQSLVSPKETPKETPRKTTIHPISTTQFTNIQNSDVNLVKNKHPEITPEKTLFPSENKNDFQVFITNPNVVIIIICVFLASLIFNIICIIRCSLMRSIIEKYAQSSKISNSCVYRFFCIRISDDLSPIKSILQPNSKSDFLGYHREEIYDMRTNSQTDRHLVNNFSQYELEQEPLQARKTWSNDGSQTLFRSTQYCQDPSMGNYVIVSGPVCSSRNHGVLISDPNIIINNQPIPVSDEMGLSIYGSHKNESSICNNSIIYSRPIINRPRSFGLFADVNGKRVSESCPPAPPVRICTDAEYPSLPSYAESAQQSLPIKKVDLIEHCAYSSVKRSPEESHT